MSFKIAVVGATGNVGREILNILDERNFPASEVVALASKKSEGKEVSFGEDKILIVQDLSKYDFSDTDIALFSPGSSISEIYAPKAASQGCVVIDNTSFFRMHDDVPLIIPEVNIEQLGDYKKKNIIANPNCSTIQMLVALKPLHDHAVIKRVVVSTYQSVSGAGRSAMDELFNQTKGIFTNDRLPSINFSKQISFNCIPQIDVFSDGGYTKEELKMINETHKILDSNIKITATCVRVPVFNCHAESLNIEFENKIDHNVARDILRESDAITIVDNPDEMQFATQLECAREDNVFISRIRNDDSCENAINMWVVSDNIRKGAALNAVQIAEALVEQYL